MNTENNTSSGKRIFTWIAFIIIVGLIIWGLIAANSKSAAENAMLVLPDQVTATDHIIGNPDAPVTVVEYGDFQCPACGEYYPIVEKLLSEEGSTTMRLVFRHFPLPQHANAIPAAIASEAASNQGQFWAMYNLLYSNQDDWVNLADPSSVFLGYAQQLNLNIPQFQADLAASSTVAVVNADMASGLKANIDATPTFFVNGTQITNPQTYADFKALIEAAASSTTATNS